MRAAREPELDPLRLRLGQLLIKIRPSLGSRNDFEQWCQYYSTTQFTFSIQVAYRWMRIAGSEDPEKEYSSDKAATTERVREHRVRKREKARAEAFAETTARAKQAADAIKLDTVEPRPVGHVQVLPDDGLPTVYSIGRMIARDLADAKQTVLSLADLPGLSHRQGSRPTPGSSRYRPLLRQLLQRDLEPLQLPRRVSARVEFSFGLASGPFVGSYSRSSTR